MIRRFESGRAESAHFWGEYRVPGEWDVVVKKKLQGEWGNRGIGIRTAVTVSHLFLESPLDEPYLHRDAETVLCDSKAYKERSKAVIEPERRKDHLGEYIPKVTCKRCLELMERWKVE